MKTPVIRISEAARRAFLDAAANAGGDPLRLEMSQSFEPEPFFGPMAEGDIAVDCDGLTILLDPSSARRVDGVSIDYVQGPNGSGFKFENPNRPRGPKQIELEAQPLPEGGHKVEIKMSMTAPGCGMGDVLKEDARAKVQAVAEVDVEIVWEPPWDQSRMSEAARLQLGML